MERDKEKFNYVTNNLSQNCIDNMLMLFDEIDYNEEQEVETNIEINKILQ